MSNQRVHPASALPYALTPLAVCRPTVLGSELGRGVVGLVGVMPKAIALIVGSSLGPEALSAARQAFDNAWAEIAGKFIGVAEKEAARLELATAILSVATNENRDV